MFIREMREKIIEESLYLKTGVFYMGEVCVGKFSLKKGNNSHFILTS